MAASCFKDDIFQPVEPFVNFDWISTCLKLGLCHRVARQRWMQDTFSLCSLSQLRNFRLPLCLRFYGWFKQMVCKMSSHFCIQFGRTQILLVADLWFISRCLCKWDRMITTADCTAKGLFYRLAGQETILFIVFGCLLVDKYKLSAPPNALRFSSPG